MRLHLGLAGLATAIMVATPLIAPAQSPGGIMEDYLRDLGGTQRKMVALARAMPADKYEWRPGPGVRSVGEVFLHVAADNYFLPAGMGIAPPPSTGIKSDDYKTADAFAARKLDKEAIVKELEDSYAFLKSAMSATTEAKLSQPATMFGATMPVRAWWLGTLSDMHEHLGQAIAYARMNGVVPPWSK
jgi:uncharacterized damage-inducible protein DinB